MTRYKPRRPPGPATGRRQSPGPVPGVSGPRPKRLRGLTLAELSAALPQGDPQSRSWDQFLSALGPVHQFQMTEWRALAIPTWQRILAEAEAQGDAQRAAYARWMLEVVLEVVDDVPATS